MSAILPWLRGVLLACLVLGGLGPAGAQDRLEILNLQHSTVEQVLPALQPLVSPGGSISSYNGKLMVRTDPRNLEEIRAALAAIDAPAARLLVSLRREGETASRRSGVELSGSLGSGDARVSRSPSGSSSSHIEYRSGGSRIELGGDSRSSAASSQASQQVQTVDGGQAYIQAGVSVPVALRQVLVQPGGARIVQGTVFRDLGSGFYARPQVLGERVRIDSAPSRPGPWALPVPPRWRNSAPPSKAASGNGFPWVARGSPARPGRAAGSSKGARPAVPSPACG